MIKRLWFITAGILLVLAGCSEKKRNIRGLSHNTGTFYIGKADR